MVVRPIAIPPEVSVLSAMNRISVHANTNAKPGPSGIYACAREDLWVMRIVQQVDLAGDSDLARRADGNEEQGNPRIGVQCCFKPKKQG